MPHLGDDKFSDTGLVPAGGTPGQVLKKVSTDSHDSAWQDDNAGGGASWGQITGTLSNQTDIQSALDTKATSSDISTALATHESAPDPHTVYLTSSEGNAAYAAVAHNHPSTDISDSTATGRSLVTATDAAAGRTTLGLGDSATKNVGTLSTQVAVGDSIAVHVAVADPHTQYQRESEKNAASGYAGLSAGSKVDGTQQTYGTGINTACQGNDSRLSDARTPLAHASSHITGGGDIIASFTSTTVGLVPASGGGTTNFLRADGSFAAPAGGVGGFDPAGLRTRPFAFTDFLGTAAADTGEASYAVWDLTLISSGTQAKIAAEPDHPGVIRISSSTTANSGGRFDTEPTTHRFNGGDSFECVFQPRVAGNTATTIRFGFRDNTTSSDAVDGVYFEVPSGSLNIVGKTSNNSTRSTTTTIATLVVNTWYRCRVELNSALTLATFTVWNDAGTQLGQQTLSTNIPTAAAREFGHGFIATNSGVVAVLLCYVDYLLQWYQSDLTR